jgi:hypothetical protein
MTFKRLGDNVLVFGGGFKAPQLVELSERSLAKYWFLEQGL